MTKILWHSVAPFVPSGYGQQTALFAPRLQDAGHEIAISSYYGLNGAALEWNGIRVYPSDQKWGNTSILNYAEKHGAELFLTLMDVWVLHPEVIKHLGIPVGCWCPVDHAPVPPKVTKFFHDSGARPIAMSRFGEEALRAEGLDPLYVPHGVDTTIYTPEPRERVRELAKLDDTFVVGIVANNSGGNGERGTVSRKAFPQSLMAFSEFHKRHPDSKLYLHTEITGRPGVEHGLDIGKLLDRFEIPLEAVMMTNQVGMEIGISAHEMAGLFSSFDVLLNPSYGEGFGIPIIEAQACGVPVIVTDWTAMPELVGAGWKIQGEPSYDGQHDAFFMAPFVGGILDALEQAYEARRDAELREKARAFALGYDADHVMETYWKPVLETLTKPREVPPLRPRPKMAPSLKQAA